MEAQNTTPTKKTPNRQTLYKVTVELWQDVTPDSKTTDHQLPNGKTIQSFDGVIVAQGTTVTDDNGEILYSEKRTGNMMLDAPLNIPELFLHYVLPTDTWDSRLGSDEKTNLLTKNLLKTLHDIQTNNLQMSSTTEDFMKCLKKYLYSA